MNKCCRNKEILAFWKALCLTLICKVKYEFQIHVHVCIHVCRGKLFQMANTHCKCQHFFAHFGNICVKMERAKIAHLQGEWGMLWAEHTCAQWREPEGGEESRLPFRLLKPWEACDMSNDTFQRHHPSLLPHLWSQPRLRNLPVDSAKGSEPGPPPCQWSQANTGNSAPFIHPEVEVLRNMRLVRGWQASASVTSAIQVHREPWSRTAKIASFVTFSAPAVLKTNCKQQLSFGHEENN